MALALMVTPKPMLCRIGELPNALGAAVIPEADLTQEPVALVGPAEAAIGPEPFEPENAVVDEPMVAEEFAAPLELAEPVPEQPVDEPAALIEQPADVNMANARDDSVGQPPLPPPPAPEAAAPRRVAERVHASPKDILSRVVPNSSFSIYLSYNDWRFKCESRIESEKFLEPYHRKTFSKVFTQENWKDSLWAVHKYAWEEWALVRDKHPADKPEQDCVPPEIFELLQPIISIMPPPTHYAKR